MTNEVLDLPTAIGSASAGGVEGVARQTVCRKVTDEEIRHFREKGWVRLRGYVTCEYAAELQRHIVSIERAKAPDTNKVFSKKLPFDWRLGDATMNDSPGRHMLSTLNGENVARLLNVDGVRFLKDKWMIKQPEASSGQGGTAYHQDFPALGLDRSSHVVIWISTVDQPGEAGLVQFRSGSHRLGSLGRNYNGEFEMHERYPELNELELSPALDMQAGDATVHGALTVHGAGPNQTSRPRYGYGCQYFDADALFTGAIDTGFEFIREQLTPNEPINHPEMPVIYRRSAR